MEKPLVIKALRKQYDNGFEALKGIDLEDLTVHSPDGFDGPLATVARIHAEQSGLEIDYRHTTAEALAEARNLDNVATMIVWISGLHRRHDGRISAFNLPLVGVRDPAAYRQRFG